MVYLRNSGDTSMLCLLIYIVLFLFVLDIESKNGRLDEGPDEMSWKTMDTMQKVECVNT